MALDFGLYGSNAIIAVVMTHTVDGGQYKLALGLLQFVSWPLPIW